MLWGAPPELVPTNIRGNAIRHMFSPYQSNPLDINPLRSLLGREIDFEAIARTCRLKVFVSATHVRTGCASLLTQMRSIDFINSLLAEGALQPHRAKHVLLHRIDGGEAMKQYLASTKSSTDATMIRNLFEMGQQRTRNWLAQHFEAIGKHGTVDIRHDYLDGDRIRIALASHQPRQSGRAFQPWLARVFKRLRLSLRRTPGSKNTGVATRRQPFACCDEMAAAEKRHWRPARRER